MKHSNIKKIALIVSAACLLLAVTVGVSFAWYVKNYQLGGMNVSTGSIGMTMTTYAPQADGSYKEIATVDNAIDGRTNADAPVSSEHEYSDIDDDKPAVFFVKIVKNSESKDFNYGLSLYLEGLLRSTEAHNLTASDATSNGDESAVGADSIFANGFLYNVKNVSDQMEGKTDAVAHMTNVAANGLTEPDQKYIYGLATVDRHVYSGELTATDNTAYYMITVMKSGEDVPDYSGRKLHMHAKVVASQQEMETEREGEVKTVKTSAELIDAIATYQPGDTIDVAQTIIIERDVIFNRPVNLFVNDGVKLTIEGNLIFSFNSNENCVINTTGGGQIVVKQINNAGGYFTINAPSSQITLKGSNVLNNNLEENRGRGDIYVENDVTFCGGYNKGVVIDGCNIYKTDSEGNIPTETTGVYKNIYLTDGAFLDVRLATTVGLVQAATDENVYTVGIHNYGTIKGINFTGMDLGTGTTVQPQIYIRNNGLIERQNGSETSPHISLPVWSRKYNKADGTGNTRIYQDESGSKMDVGLSNKDTDYDTEKKPFANEDVELPPLQNLVCDNTGVGEDLTVYYYDTTDGSYNDGTDTEKSYLGRILNKFFKENGTEIGSVTSLTVISPTDKFLTADDYEYMKNLTKVINIDLSNAYTEVSKDAVISYGGTYANQLSIVGDYACTPKNAFNDMPSLQNVSLPANTQVICYPFAQNSGIKEIYLPSTVIACEVDYAMKAQNNQNILSAKSPFVSTRYVHFTNQSVAPKGLGYIVSFDDAYPIHIVPDQFVNECKDLYKDGGVSWKRRVVPSSEIAYENVKDESGNIVKVEYLLHQVGNNAWEIVHCGNEDWNKYYTSSELGSNMSDKSGDRKYTISSIGYAAFYSCSSNDPASIYLADSISNVGDYAFYATDINDIRGEGVTTVGSYGFSEMKYLYTVWLPNAEEIGASAFSSCECLKTAVLGRPRSWSERLFGGATEDSGTGKLVRVLIAAEGKNPDGFVYNGLPNMSSNYVVCVQASLYNSYGSNCFASKERAIVIEDEYFAINNLVVDKGFDSEGKPIYGKPVYNVTSADFTTTGGAKYIGCLTEGGAMLMGDWSNKISVSNSGEAEVNIPETFHINNEDHNVVRISNRAFLSHNVEIDGNAVLTIPDTVKRIDNYAFYKLKFNSSVPQELRSIKLSLALERIEDTKVFAGSEICSVNFNNNQSLKYIGSYAFESCKMIEEMIVPDSVTEFGEQAFSYCEKLKKVIGNGVEKVGDRCFNEASVLETVELPVAKSAGVYAFFKTSELSHLDLPKLTSLGEAACRQSGITYISAPNCTTVSKNCFESCNVLAEVYLPKCTSLGTGTFKNCEYIAKITLGSFRLVSNSYFDNTIVGVIIINGNGVRPTTDSPATLHSSAEKSYKGGRVFMTQTAKNNYEAGTSSSAYKVGVRVETLSAIEGKTTEEIFESYCSTLGQVDLKDRNGNNLPAYYYRVSDNNTIRILCCNKLELTGNDLAEDFADMLREGYSIVLEDYLFHGRNVSGILDLSNVKEIKECAFKGNISESVIFDDATETIGANAFDGYAKTVIVNVKKQENSNKVIAASGNLFAADATLYVTTVVENAYRSNGGLANATDIKTYGYSYTDTTNGVQFFFEAATGGVKLSNVLFGGENAPVTVKIPDTIKVNNVDTNVVGITSDAFANVLAQERVEELVIPKYLKADGFVYDGTKMFTNLQKFSVSQGCQNFSAGEDGVLYNIAGETKILWAYPVAKPGTNYQIGADVTSISSSAFTGAKELQTFSKA